MSRLPRLGLDDEWLAEPVGTLRPRQDVGRATRSITDDDALTDTVIALTVKFEDMPRVAPRERIELVKLGEGFWHITVHYGFVQVPDLPAALRQARDRGCSVDLKDAIYFGAWGTVVCSKRRSWLVRARLWLFTPMFRNSVRGVDLFNIPTESFVEVGRRIEI